ncbi:hypothetical protein SZN_19590, partial [Streptomyces zinciresistens K42]
MVTFAQAQERAEEWINGDVPSYQHREVRVREFGLGFVVWPEDRADGPRSDGGAQRLVIARDSGEATLWPALPVGEVIRRYEERYGRDEAVADAVPAPSARVDLHQTSFLLTPPEWLQEAADRMGIPGRREGAARAASDDAGPEDAVPSAGEGAPGVPDTGAPAETLGGPPPAAPVAPVPVAPVPVAPGVPEGATPWAGTDTNADGEDLAVPLPETVFAPPLSGDDGVSTPPEAQTALLSGGSRLPDTAIEPALADPHAPGGAGRGATPPPAPTYGYPQGVNGPATPPAPSAPVPGRTPPPPPGVPASSYGQPRPQGVPGQPPAPSAGDIADAATSKAAPPRARGGATPPPPGVPGTPGVGGPPPAPGVPADGYVPTQLVSALAPDGPGPVPPGTPGAPGT